MMSSQPKPKCLECHRLNSLCAICSVPESTPESLPSTQDVFSQGPSIGMSSLTFCPPVPCGCWLMGYSKTSQPHSRLSRLRGLSGSPTQLPIVSGQLSSGPILPMSQKSNKFLSVKPKKNI